MAHKTTVIEFTMEPSELFPIVRNWANESGFSFYGHIQNRNVYCKNVRFSKAWMSVENNGENIRIETWLSSPSVGPDFEGNAWVGWKTPLRRGFLMGPVLTCRNQIDTLLNLLRSKTQNLRQKNSSQQTSNAYPALNKSTLSKGLAIVAVIGLLTGTANLISATGLLLRSTYRNLGNAMLVDGIFDVIIGLLILAASRAVAKGRTLAIWLYGASILVDSAFNIAMNRPMNYVFIGLGLLFIWQMFRLKNEKQLS